MSPPRERRAPRGRFVVKMQVSLAQSPGTPPSVLIYNKANTLRQVFEDPEQYEAARLALDGEPKGYFYACVDADETLLIGEPAPAQLW